jgi:hypothetical protein
MRRATFVTVIVAACVGVSVQAAAQSGNPLVWSDARTACGNAATFDGGLDCAIRIVSETPREIHPTVESIAPGTSTALGARYLLLADRGTAQRYFRATGLISFDKSWAARLSWQHVGETRDFEAYGLVRKLQSQNFFGLGRSASVSDRTVYGFRETIAGVSADQRAPWWLTIGGLAEWRDPVVQTGASSAPSIGQRFTDVEAPGLTKQPMFARLMGRVRVQYPDPENAPATVTALEMRAEHMQALESDVMSTFHRISIEASHTQRWTRRSSTASDVIPAHFNPIDLQLLGRTSHAWAPAGNVVPFYYQDTLGGTDAEGRDTLRGYDDFRFRGPTVLLLQGDLTILVRSPIGVVVFVDAGAVASDFSGLRWDGRKTDYGVGLTASLGNQVKLRAYWAFGGEVHGMLPRLRQSF